MVYMIFFPPCSLLSVFCTERYGVGVAMNVLCSWTRVGGSYHPGKPIRFGLVLLGQCIAAFGQPFLLNAPPRVANDWFPVDEVSLKVYYIFRS